MNKLGLSSGLALACALLVSPAYSGSSTKCVTLSSGTLVDAAGVPLSSSTDMYGYNFQSYYFDGLYCEADREFGECEDDSVGLFMWWNAAWLSNSDCDADGQLDRHYGYDTYQGSGAMLMIGMEGDIPYNGTTCYWAYTAKIGAVPSGAYVSNDVWYSSSGSKLGSSLWGFFAVNYSYYYDTCAGAAKKAVPAPTCPGI